MANEKIKDVGTILIILFFVIIVSVVISMMGNEASSSSNALLSDSSSDYINNIGTNSESNFNTSIYYAGVEDPLASPTGDNKDEFSKEFNYGKSTSGKIKSTLYIIVSVPSYLGIDVLKLPKANFSWFFSLLNWIYRIFILLILYGLVRGKI